MPSFSKIVVWIFMGFSLQSIQVATIEKEIVSLILSVKVIPTQIIGISRESGNCTETEVLWTTNERDLKKSGIPEMIGTILEHCGNQYSWGCIVYQAIHFACEVHVPFTPEFTVEIHKNTQSTFLAGFFLLHLQELNLTVTRKTIHPPGEVVLKDHHMNERQIVQHMIMGLLCLEVQFLYLKVMLEYYEK